MTACQYIDFSLLSNRETDASIGSVSHAVLSHAEARLNFIDAS